MFRAFALIALLAGCPREQEAARVAPGPPSSPPEPTPTGIDATAPVNPLPATIGPPAPFDRVRPHMKHADVQAALLDAGARTFDNPPRTLIPEGYTAYLTAMPYTLAYVGYDNGRLDSITIVGQTELAVRHPATTRWGAGQSRETGFSREIAWPASDAGWEAELQLPHGQFRAFEPRLRFSASRQAASTTIAASDKLFAQLAASIGAPLETAVTTFGPGLQRETSDDEDTAPERTARRQGFANVAVAWSAQPWQLVMRTDPDERVVSVELAGSTSDDATRTLLFDALRAELGAARPVVSKAGYVEIELVAKKVVVRCRELGTNQWSISLGR